MTAILELDHVWKSFRGVGALRDVSFAINPGEVVCLLGDNGAGKSTLVKIMSGVHSPDRGRLLVRGQPVTRWSPKNSRRAGIETIYQDKALAPRQTVARNIFMGRELTNAFGLIADRRQAAQADSLLRRLGFTSKVLNVNSLIAGLSGGEQEGVAIGLFQGAVANPGRADDCALAHPVAAGPGTRDQGPLRGRRNRVHLSQYCARPQRWRSFPRPRPRRDRRALQPKRDHLSRARQLHGICCRHPRDIGNRG